MKELKTNYCNEKSFYGKANIIEYPDYVLLQSYKTIVAQIEEGKAIVNGTYSPTTLRHIKEFLKQFGFKAESKAQIERDYLGRLNY